MSSSRRVWAEIDLGALRENLALARARLPRATKDYIGIERIT